MAQAGGAEQITGKERTERQFGSVERINVEGVGIDNDGIVGFGGDI